jgi:hypothetical protein
MLYTPQNNRTPLQYQPQQQLFNHHSQDQSESLYFHNLDIDPAFDDNASDLVSASVSSSPHSTQSFLSQYSAIPAIAIPGKARLGAGAAAGAGGLLEVPSSTSPSNFDDLSFDQSQLSDLMQSDPWYVGGGPFTPKSLSRISHNRESSLSSLGSAGPASPYSHNTSNPHIAVTDSASDGFGDMHSHDNSLYHLAKSMEPAHDGLYASYHPYSAEHSATQMGYPTAVAMQKPKGERGLLPAPDFASAFSRSHPGSVASSIGGDSPDTPTLGEPEEHPRRKAGKASFLPEDFLTSFSPDVDFAAFNSVPKLDRTMTDIYSDELYSPNFTITSASPPPPSQISASPSSDVFNQRLHAANSQHLNAAHSPVSTGSRGRSAFRQGSPLAPVASHDFGPVPHVHFNSAQQLREQKKAEQDAQVLRQQQLARGQDPDTPKTISPKDAILEFHEPEGDANFPLFSSESSTFEYNQMAKQVATQAIGDAYHQRPVSASGHGSTGYAYASQLPSDIPLPQQYPFIAHSRPSHDLPARLPSTESTSGDSATRQTSLQKPGGSGAEGGTYTCTYHGCTLRFETPALLQKHKREGHRQAQGLTGPRRVDNGLSAGVINSQAGPHRCDRINPSTGKPCSTIFSRPYDLTRHEDTIHNARKQKVRCSLCTEEKTFSRADALTRHFRVCHPDVEFPGKHRRRGGHS